MSRHFVEHRPLFGCFGDSLCLRYFSGQNPQQAYPRTPLLHTHSPQTQASNAPSALRTDRRADQAIGKINRRADQGTGKNGHFAKH